MFKVKIFSDTGHGEQCWKDDTSEYETYDKALIDCYNSAIYDTNYLMSCSDINNWFEVSVDFEVTKNYITDVLKEDIGFFPVAVIYYDKAPWDRDNDCDIKIVTGYLIIVMEE